MLVIAGNIVVGAAEVDAFAADLRKLAILAQKAEGCHFFACAVEDPADGRMLLLEHWRDEDVLNAYLAHPQVASFFAHWREKMRNELRRFSVIDDSPSVRE